MNKQLFIENYLRRICFHGLVEINIETLQRLQRHHLLNVPFENLDIMAGKPLSMDKAHLFEKIILNKRGGICYELNSLFEELLTLLGFKVDVLAGQVLEDGSEYDHLFLMVEIENTQYLVDVGFGDNFLEPIKFELNRPQRDAKGWFQIIEKEAGGFELLHANDGVDYKKAYSFSIKPRQHSEFVERCRWFENNDASIFRRNKLCSLERENGRISMKDSRLIITDKTERTEQVIACEETFQSYLMTYFNMELFKINQ